LGTEGVQRLAAASVLGRLTTLDLSRNGLSHDLDVLVQSPHPLRLKTLCLRGNAIGAAGVTALKALSLHEHSRHGTLTALDVSHNAIGPDVLRSLLADAGLSAPLIFLGLGFCRLGVAGIQVLAGRPHTARLRRLNLSHCDLGDQGVQALATEPLLGQLAE